MENRRRPPDSAKQPDGGRPVSKTRLRLGEVRRHPPEVDLSSETEMMELLPDPGVEAYLRSLEDGDLGGS